MPDAADDAHPDGRAFFGSGEPSYRASISRRCTGYVSTNRELRRPAAVIASTASSDSLKQTLDRKSPPDPDIVDDDDDDGKLFWRSGTGEVETPLSLHGLKKDLPFFGEQQEGVSISNDQSPDVDAGQVDRRFPRWRKPRQEVPEVRGQKDKPSLSSEKSLLVIFHARFLETDPTSNKERIHHLKLHSHKLNKLCDNIKRLVLSESAGTNYEIKDIFIENKPGDDKIDIHKFITNKEHLEDCNKVMELTKTNSEVKVVAEFIPTTDCNDTKTNSEVNVVTEFIPTTGCNDTRIPAADDENLMNKLGQINCCKMINETKVTTVDDETLISDICKHKDPSKLKVQPIDKQQVVGIGFCDYGENATTKQSYEQRDLLEKNCFEKQHDHESEFQEPNAFSKIKQKKTVGMTKSFCTDASNDAQATRSQEKIFKYLDKYESDDSVFSSDTESSKIHFVGLVNQAMTCYLNSLLQALYMTPEFRNALYTWEYTGTEKEATNIPFQLQKLFLNLQTSEKSVETTALTQSFGWDSTEAWNQHDIQELCRVMFDALEKTFKTTKHPDFINRLYEGKILDYVKCLTCNLEKSREDSFLDIPLPLRSFDGSVTYGSVEEALEAFVKYETLEGNNQYFCEKCNKKSNAHKGLKFSKFPYILTLQLKRFDFDHNTFHRIKLNDKVTFPDKLNLNLFIASNQETPSQENTERNAKCDDTAADESSSVIREESSNMPLSNNSNHLTNSNHDQDDDEGEGIEMCNGLSAHNDIDKMREHYAKATGPYIYELFCIMIHSGSANGGHYYAYIKDFRNNKWWCFDDQRVSHITEKDIQNTYGGGSGRTPYYSSQYRSSTNAYMLMYRQIDSKRNVLPIEAENFPPHLKSLLERMTHRCEGDNNYIEIEPHEQKTKLCILYRRPEDQELDQVEITVSGPTVHTVGDIAIKAFRKSDLKGLPYPERLRLVYYNKKYNLVERVLPSDKRIEIFSDQYQIKDLMLEVLQPNEEFEPHPSDPIITKVYLVNPSENELIDGPKYVRAHAEQSIREYKEQLKKHFNIDPEVVRLLIPEIVPNKLMEDDDKFEAHISGNYPYKVIATEFYNTCKEKRFQYSDYFDMSTRLMNTVTFYIDSSNVSEKTLNLLKIPSLQNYYIEEKTRDKVSNHNHLSEELSKIHVSPDKGKSTSSEGIDTVGNQFTTYDKGNLWNLVYAEANNSEDSSLSDSDKTIVNEETTENAVMLDEEAQSYVSAKGFDTQQPLFNKTTNGVLPACDVLFKIEYLKKEKLWLITMDKDITEDGLKERLEPYIKVPKNYFKVTLSPLDSTYCSQSGKTTFRDERKFAITLGRVLQPDENPVEIFALRMGDSVALQKLLETGVNTTCRVGLAKHQIYSELRKIGCVDVPLERLRFAEVIGDQTVGDELENIEKSVRFINSICVQVLPPNDNHESSNYVQVYLRRWNRSKMQLDDPQEIRVPKSTFIKDLIKQVSVISSISEECLEFSVQIARKSFLLTKIEGFEWKSEVSLTEVDFKSYIMYRDSKEIPKEENDKTDWYYKRERYSNTITGVPYSRREKALKIHVDT